MKVLLVYAPAARNLHEVALEVPAGTSLEQLLSLSGWLDRFPEIMTLTVGIWNRQAPRDTLLRDGDRVEIYRDLRVDPKVARRERFVGQGARGAGLFSKRRPGSKAGY